MSNHYAVELVPRGQNAIAAQLFTAASDDANDRQAAIEKAMEQARSLLQQGCAVTLLSHPNGKKPLYEGEGPPKYRVMGSMGRVVAEVWNDEQAWKAIGSMPFGSIYKVVHIEDGSLAEQFVPF